MTVALCKKCRFFSSLGGSCALTRGKVSGWDDACPSYDLKEDLKL